MDLRAGNLGHWLLLALRRFDGRVLQLLASSETVSLALSNLARRGQLTAAHIHITRHLAPEGLRLGELARRAGVTKQAMGRLVDQCVAWDLVRREPDARDARASVVRFTPAGLAWLQAYNHALLQAQAELRAAVGAEVATVLAIGLEAYAA